MERRRSFTDGDLTQLANLCHDCRGCYYACQYAPPHEFNINVPKVFSELRRETYRDNAWPRSFGRLFERNGLWVTLITLVSLVLVVAPTVFFQDIERLIGVHTGEGAFYVVIPYAVMVGVPSAISVLIVLAFVIGFVGFWRTTGAGWPGLGAFGRACIDVAILRNLGGGGGGCTYPGEAPSSARRWLHQFMAYGFVLAFAATTVAAIYDHFLAWQAPYPLFSLPVILGTLGGVGLVIGTGGLLWLKRSMDPDPSDPGRLAMDVGLLVLLFLTASTGLAVLAVRDTSAMGLTLAVHLGFVLALFLTLPYGKFVHGLYRFAALLRDAMERAEERRPAADPPTTGEN
jgi:citrate/tricarballylate utilization protein